MIQNIQRPEVQKIIRSLLVFPEQNISNILNNLLFFQKFLYKCLCKNINYAFDLEVRKKFDRLIQPLDVLLNTKYVSTINRKINLKYESLLKILQDIQKQFYSRLGENRKETHQMILNELFQNELEYWTFKQLQDFLNRKIVQYTQIIDDRQTLSQSQKRQLKGYKNFLNQFIAEYQFNIKDLEELIQCRLSQAPADEISFLGNVSLSNILQINENELEDASENIILQALQQSNQNDTKIIKSQQQSTVPRNTLHFSKKQNGHKQQQSNLSREEQSKLSREEQSKLQREEQSKLQREEQSKLQREEQSKLSREEQSKLSREEQSKLSREEQSTLSREEQSRQKQLKLYKKEFPIQRSVDSIQKRQNAVVLGQQKKQKAPKIEINEIDFIPRNMPLGGMNNRQAQRQQRQRINDSYSFSFDNIESLETSKIQKTSKERQQLDRRNRSIYQRYASQLRFSQIMYRSLREMQVKTIEKNQLHPILQILKSMRIRDIYSQQKSERKVDQVQVYGSFRNKCGFRKISDLNINIEIKELLSLSQKQQQSCVWNLQKYVKNSAIQGNLMGSLKSVMINAKQGQIILSHRINQRLGQRDQNIVNFIFITINKKEYVESSLFMGDVILQNKQQSKQDIFHLINFLHLLFKRSNILENDFYRQWIANDWSNKTKKQAHQKKQNYVGLSVYALHMMVLYYLQKTRQITESQFDKSKKTYFFKLKPNTKQLSLYQNLVGFLRFYSSKGQYNSNQQLIDVAARFQTDNIHFQVGMSLENMEKYTFAFVHPKINQLIEYYDGKHNRNYVSFELQKNSEKLDALKGNLKFTRLGSINFVPSISVLIKYLQRSEEGYIIQNYWNKIKLAGLKEQSQL